MPTTKKTKSNKTAYPLRLPDDTWAAVKQITQARNQPIANYVRDAVQLKLMVDGVGVNANTLTKLIQSATTPLMESANFGAIHATASLIFLREFAKTVFHDQGLPEHLAQEKAAMLAANALDEATNTFEDPQNRVQFGWIERFDEETLALLEDDGGDDE